MAHKETKFSEQHDPITLVTPRREITGISAVLLPYNIDHTVDWPGFDLLIERTLNAGLMPAVNMDTGFDNLIDDSTRLEVLRRTALLDSVWHATLAINTEGHSRLIKNTAEQDECKRRNSQQKLHILQRLKKQWCQKSNHQPDQYARN